MSAPLVLSNCRSESEGAHAPERLQGAGQMEVGVAELTVILLVLGLWLYSMSLMFR